MMMMTRFTHIQTRERETAGGQECERESQNVGLCEMTATIALLVRAVFMEWYMVYVCTSRVHFRGERRHTRLDERLEIVPGEVKRIRDGREMFGGDLRRGLVTLGYAHRMNAIVQEHFGLLEEGASEHDDSGSTITDLIVLALGQLDEEAADRVHDFHALQDGCAVVCCN